MPREELPPDADLDLTYDELIDLLSRVDGEPVYATVGRYGSTDGTAFGFLLGAYGILKGPSPYRQSMRCSIVPPDGSRRTGGELAIPRPGFQRAGLSTIDGNSFFRFSVTTDHGTLTIADEGSGP